MSTTTKTIVKDLFRNDSGGVAGAVTIDPRGGTVSIAVHPGDSVWLTEEEQALTANAPRHAEDNPFINGTFVLVAEAQDIKHHRPLRPTAVEVPGEVGAAPVAAGPAPEGERAPTEEVGTPEAVPTEEEAVEVTGDGKHITRTRRKPQS